MFPEIVAVEAGADPEVRTPLPSPLRRGPGGGCEADALDLYSREYVGRPLEMRYGSDWPVTASVYQPTPEPNIKKH